jgi:hypothetical protein
MADHKKTLRFCVIDQLVYQNKETRFLIFYAIRLKQNRPGKKRKRFNFLKKCSKELELEQNKNYQYFSVCYRCATFLNAGSKPTRYRQGQAHTPGFQF